MSAESVKQELVGTWLLESAVFKDKNGDSANAVGANPKGILMLDRTGHFSFQLMGDKRVKYAAGDRLGGTPAEHKGVATGTIACFGKYSVDPAGRTLTFHVKGHSYRNWEGGDLKRTIIKLAGDELTDSNPKTSWGGTSTIVWKRAQ